MDVEVVDTAVERFEGSWFDFSEDFDDCGKKAVISASRAGSIYRDPLKNNEFKGLLNS